MRSILASKRRHPSYGYEVPEPRSHVHLLEDEGRPGEPELDNVVDLAAARIRLRTAS